jgi:hypothetical protein
MEGPPPQSKLPFGRFELRPCKENAYYRKTPHCGVLSLAFGAQFPPLVGCSPTGININPYNGIYL